MRSLLRCWLARWYLWWFGLNLFGRKYSMRTLTIWKYLNHIFCSTWIKFVLRVAPAILCWIVWTLRMVNGEQRTRTGDYVMCAHKTASSRLEEQYWTSNSHNGKMRKSNGTRRTNVKNKWQQRCNTATAVRDTWIIIIIANNSKVTGNGAKFIPCAICWCAYAFKWDLNAIFQIRNVVCIAKSILQVLPLQIQSTSNRIPTSRGIEDIIPGLRLLMGLWKFSITFHSLFRSSDFSSFFFIRLNSCWFIQVTYPVRIINFRLVKFYY